MSPTEVNRAVADVLGEALSVVRQRGFSLLEPEYEKPANRVSRSHHHRLGCRRRRRLGDFDLRSRHLTSTPKENLSTISFQSFSAPACTNLRVRCLPVV